MIVLRTKVVFKSWMYLLLSAFLSGCTSENSSTESAQSEMAVETEDGEQEVFLESGEFTFVHDGISRTYILYVPENLPANSPLLFVNHGYGSNASFIRYYSEMDRVAAENNFAVVYPNGLPDEAGQQFFHIGYESNGDVDTDDVSFLRDLANYLTSSSLLDSRNVFSTGMSNGADMSFLLACEAPQTFRAVAPVTGTMMDDNLADCVHNTPMPVLAINGTADSITWYDGDMENWGGYGPYLSTPDVIAYWVQHNQLDQLETTSLEDKDPNDGSRVVWERYWSQSTEAEVWLYRVENGEHDWPGSFGNNDIDSSREIWSFLSRFVVE